MRDVMGKLPYKNLTVPSYESDKLKSSDLGAAKQLDESLSICLSIHSLLLRSVARSHPLIYGEQTRNATHSQFTIPI